MHSTDGDRRRRYHCSMGGMGRDRSATRLGDLCPLYIQSGRRYAGRRGTGRPQYEALSAREAAARCVDVFLPTAQLAEEALLGELALGQ
jgi:hypothetical protein